MMMMGMIKEEIDKLINKTPGSPSLYEFFFKMHFAKLFFSLGEYSTLVQKDKATTKKRRNFD